MFIIQLCGYIHTCYIYVRIMLCYDSSLQQFIMYSLAHFSSSLTFGRAMFSLTSPTRNIDCACALISSYNGASPLSMLGVSTFSLSYSLAKYLFVIYVS